MVLSGSLLSPGWWHKLWFLEMMPTALNLQMTRHQSSHGSADVLECCESTVSHDYVLELPGEHD